jgi:hypothetical protein
MATTGLDFSKLTPSNGALTDLRELIFLSVLGADRLGKILNILPGQLNGKKAGFVGEFEMLGRPSTGCNPEYIKAILATSEKTWDIAEWEIPLSICYEDLKGTLAQTAMRTKTQVADLTGTEYMDYVLEPRLQLAVLKMLFRFAWFGNKTATNVSEGGDITDGKDPQLFTVTDGLWKRIFAIGTADPDRHTPIAANAEATKALQKSALYQPGVATGILDSLIIDAAPVLKESENQVIFITNSLAEALKLDIRNNNKGSELQWESWFNGIEMTKYSGKTVITLPLWDEIIRSCEDKGTTFNKPHRAVYTIVDNLLVGTESENEIAELDVFFDKKAQENYILSKDTIGTMIAQDDLVQAAY